MPALPTIVVAGVPNLAVSLQGANVFPRVFDAPSSSRLRAVVTGSELRGVPASDLIFICGDALSEDDPAFTLAEFVRKVTSAGYRVIVVSVTPRGAEVQRQNPKSILLHLPLTINAVLYAVGTFGVAVSPVAGGTDEIEVDPRRVATQPLAPAQTVAAPVEQAPAQADPNAPRGWQPVESSPVEQAPVHQPPAQQAPVQQPPAQQAPTPFQVPQTPAYVAPVEPSPYTPPAQSSPQPRGLVGSDWTPPARTFSDLAGGSRAAAPAAPAPQSYQNPEPAAPAGWNTQAGWQQAPAPAQAPSPMQSWGPASRGGAQPVEAPKRRGYVITISVSKGGTGKSSMTLNLAAFLGMRLRAQGKTVCVIDANTQQADSGKYLDVYHPNIATIVNDPNLLSEDRIVKALVHRPEYNMSVLLGPATPDEANPISINPRMYNEVLDLLKLHYDYIIIDTPVAEKFHEMFSEFALARADYLIVPVAPNFTTLHNADNWLRSAVVAPRHENGAGFDRNRIGVVLNRAEDGIGCSEDDVRATMANWHYIGAIPETKEWKAANNRNELVAPKNFADLSHAFAEVLHAATREPSLLENFATLEAPKAGVLDRLRGLVGRR